MAATVLCPYRFRTKRQFWSYCGLVVVTRSSADWNRSREGRWERSTRQVSRLSRLQQYDEYQEQAHDDVQDDK